MGHRGERGGMEAQGERGDGGTEEGVGRGVTVGGPGCAAGVIFGDDFVDGCGKIDKQVLFDVA